MAVVHDETAESAGICHLPNGIRSQAKPWFPRCKTCCWRIEREAVTLASSETVNRDGQRFLNRLPDLLFVCARVILRRNGDPEVLWTQK